MTGWGAPMVADATLRDWLATLASDPILWISLLSGVGLWLLLPRGRAQNRFWASLPALAGLLLFGSLLADLGTAVGKGVFFPLAALTIVSAAATIISRTPVYSAIWFALVLLGTAGLFLFQGAQFLGIATVVVYAGAILVTFLFVLMLAQPQGHAYYDRISWEALLASFTAAVLLGLVANAIRVSFHDEHGATAIGHQAESAEVLSQGVLADEHVASVGRELFGRHLVAVEVVGCLLLVALVGAVAIVEQGKQT